MSSCSKVPMLPVVKNWPFIAGATLMPRQSPAGTLLETRELHTGLINDLINLAAQFQITAATASRHAAHRRQHNANSFFCSLLRLVEFY